MLKKALQVATAFGVLLAGYAGYVRLFALVAGAVSLSGPTVPRLVPAPSRTHLKAIRLAEQAFGPEHWAAARDLPIRLYNADRGFWMYARDYVRHKDGKHVDFSPFAIIWVSADGRALKTATSDHARIELDQPFNLAPSKPGASSSLRVVHARLEGAVHLRDDKGTPRNPADDLRIGPLSWIDYDEKALQINSESDVVIQDDVYRVTGTGLLIKLRPKDDGQEHPPGTPTGFEDAQTAYLFKNVHIVISDVGAGGILPGTSAAPPKAPAAGPGKGEPNPLDLRCDGLMRVDFPRRPVPAEVGPPEPKGPTVAQFSRNVEVLRGKPGPYRDQLNSDHLRLTLVPPEKSAPAESANPADAPLNLDPLAASADPGSADAPDPTAPSPAAKGPMTDLTLKEAVASGHNVRLVSAAQDVKVRCNELIYKKQPPPRPGQPADSRPDTTYFRGDRTTGLIVEKIDRVLEGPTKGQVTSFTTIRAIDATIFDDHRGNDYAVIVASGPGEMESRPGPGLNGPVERTAHWNDLLTIRPVNPPAPGPGSTAPATAAVSAPVRKRITLTGKPGFVDIPAKATLDGRDKQSTIVILLRPKTKPPAASGSTAAAPSSPGSGSYEIEHLVASRDVLLVTPGKTLTARNDLQAAFVPKDVDVVPAAGPASGAKAPAVPAPTPAPSVAPAPSTSPAPAAPAKPTEPEARAVADRVWARVFLLPTPAAQGAAGEATAPATASPGLLGGSGGNGGARKAEVDEVRLRGTVVIHQDPSAGKARGTEIAGEAVDLYNQGGKGSKFIVYSAEPKPQAVAPRAEADANAPAADVELFTPLAMVDSDEMVIRGRRIGLDQATDQAWVDGNGSLTQLAARGLLSDKGLGGQKPAEARNKPAAPAAEKTPKPAPTTPMTIYFGDGMRFFGKSTDPTGKAVARAEFFKDVHAETEDSSLDCREKMKTYFDRTIKLARPAKPASAPKPDPSAEPEPAEPKAELALIECFKDVVVVNTKRDPERKAIIQKQKIVGDRLTYDKLTGRFKVPGEGVVYLYELDGKSSTQKPNPAPPVAGGGRVIRPTAGPGRDQAAPVRRGADVVGRVDARNPADPAAVRDPAPAKKGRKAAPKPFPLVLTEVRFSIEMHGRFGSGKDTDKTEDRWADFFGDVEALRARVAGPDATLDPERPTDDAMSLTAQTMRVVSEPPKAEAVEKDPNAPPRSLLKAWENAFAATVDTTIQADIITYDSQSSNLYAYGEEGRDVVIARQDHIGQTPTVAPGRTLQYNVKTGQSTLADPKSFAYIDAKTGYRPSSAKPDDKKEKPRLAPRKPFRNPANGLERKGYTGT